MDMVQLIPEGYPEMVQDYSSSYFSIRHNSISGSTTYKRSVSYTPPPAPTTNATTFSGHLTITGPITVNAPMYNPHAVSANTITGNTNDDNRLNVNITVRNGELIDMKFIQKKTNSFTFAPELSEDGGTIHHAVLFIGDEKMIHNGVLIDMNSPDAFTHDISTDTDVSIMDLYSMKEYYETRTKKY